jgi:hypothetical protein
MDLNEITFWDSNSVPKKLQELAQLFSPQSMVDTVWKNNWNKIIFLDYLLMIRFNTQYEDTQHEVTQRQSA